MRTLGNKSLRQDLRVGTLLLYRKRRTVSRNGSLITAHFPTRMSKRRKPVSGGNVYFLPLSAD
jgi:hypothetical protein